jgi:hypothetical protein
LHSTSHPHFTIACNIHGTNSGICTNKYHPSTHATNGNELDLDAIQQAKMQWMVDMPYCGRWIASCYFSCVPSRPRKEWAHPDAYFQLGRLKTYCGGNGTMTDANGPRRWWETQFKVESKRTEKKSLSLLPKQGLSRDICAK